MLDGEPVFLFGFYHVSLNGPRRSQLLVDDINAIADAGFDLVHAFIGQDDPQVQEILDTAEQRGVYIIAQFWWGPNRMREALTLFRDDPALIGWMVADDFSSPWDGPETSPEEVKARTDVVHELDEQGFAYGAAAGDPRYPTQDYTEVMDAFGIEVYPVSSLNRPFETVLEESVANYAHNRAILPDNKPMFALPQTFAWSDGRYPTPAETRNFIFGALINNANSILAYTFWDQGGLLPENNPDQWQELILLKQDVDKFKPVLLDGSLSTYDPLGSIDSIYPLTRGSFPPGVEKARIHAGIWEDNGNVYVVVLNTSQTEVKQAAIPLPQGVTGDPVPFYNSARYGTGLTIQDGQLVGSVNPEEVHVYQIHG
jgi:hypothetical protein